MITRGHKYTLVMVSLTKRALIGEMPPEMRLVFLQHVEKMSDQVMTPEVIARIEPICDDGYAIVREAIKLGWPAALDIFADKFSAFVSLNPSLLTIEGASHGRHLI